EGKIQAARFARENGVPYLGICLGMQVAIVEFGRHALGLADANSTEFNRATPHPVIALISEWQDQSGGTQVRDESSAMGATMRLGAQEVVLGAGTRAREIFARDMISERHRHRYEFNNNFLDRYRQGGLRFSGFSRDGLVEVIELANHPWFVATQFHPEFTSTPRDGHPLFTGKIQAARFAREHGVPYLGICLGMQVAIVEFGRHVLGLTDANSTEFNRATPHPVIALISEWQDQERGVQQRDEASMKGATMRLGAQEVVLGAGTHAREIYARDLISERHR